MTTPSSSTLSISTPPTRKYDVFISYLGADVKHTLLRRIYSALHDAGMRVFLDATELEVGDSVPAAIQNVISTASVHIAIFSPRYAESIWCLLELSFMLKTGAKIIPIYYHVDPSHLRYIDKGKGMYADAFLQHENRNIHSSAKIEEWKSTLRDVSLISGFMISDNIDEVELVKRVVNSVFNITGKKRLVVVEHLVGLDEAVEDFEKTTLQSAERHQNVEIVGIVGMGGCGKTTLAKELYDRKSSSYDGYSFISEVRKVSKNNLYNLQKKLLEDLVDDVEDLTFDNVDHGKVILEHHLRTLRVLIVLDDIDYMYQLVALMAAKDSLGPGSLVIVTTRDIGILKSFGISSIYKMKGLNRRDAEQLFCWHAFDHTSPLPGFEDLVEKFLEACNGLPLTLKVLGGLLYKKSKDYWESQSQEISRLLPDDIKQRLKLSYDALDEETREVFLDVACFFIGEKMSSAISIWDRSGWNGKRSIDTLVDKSLVELDHQNRITMHSQIRDLGREIAFQNTPCRFSSQAQIISKEKPAEFHRKAKDSLAYELDKISGILIKNKNQIPTVLAIKGNFLKGDCSHLTRELQWLRWHDCPHSSIPSGMSLQNLRILDLTNGFFNKLWFHNVEVLFSCSLKVLLFAIFIVIDFNINTPYSAFCFFFLKMQLPKLLREIYISGSIGEFPKSIGQLQHLEIIDISGWPNTRLKALPEEFCHLKSLKNLTLRWCRALASLPSHFGNLTNLQQLDLSFCDGLQELPQSFEQLMKLNYLDFQGCEKLMISSHFLGKIADLEHLNLKDCRKLKVLPVQVPCQLYLRSLNLVGTNLRRLPNEVGRLVNLKVLEIGSPYLTDLPISLGNLTNLRTLNIVECCKSLTCLPDSLGLLRDISINVPEALKETLGKIVKENIEPDKKD